MLDRAGGDLDDNHYEILSKDAGVSFNLIISSSAFQREPARSGQDRLHWFVMTISASIIAGLPLTEPDNISSENVCSSFKNWHIYPPNSKA